MKYFKEVKGILWNTNTLTPYGVPVVVQLTSDKRGKSLSLAAADVMLCIPLESVSDVLKIKEEKDG